ncbi:MAG: response regulator transcription factor [Cyanobacteriota bacterium]
MNTPDTYKILLIEDDSSISFIVKSSLEARNHQVTLIENGLEALNFIDQLKEDSFDVILLDINLPDANGWQILAKIRALHVTSYYTVIMLTGINDDLTESRALLEGADDYIVKPCTMSVLLAHIEANLRKKSTGNTVKIELPFSNDKFEPLSDREAEILRLVVQGYSNKEIGEMTFISESTVVNHVRSIFKKLHLTSRIQVAVAAIKYNLI